ncbi:MAG: putative GTP-binding protein [Deltaproteobacteria bacterium]|nr:putative GTP-binding protein [Deltaproteobacteria bacterium]
MGTTNKPQQVKLFASILFRDNENLLKTLDILSEKIGVIEEQTPVAPFLHTNYYEKEMGRDLMRTFILFGALVEREFLPEVKLITNEIEQSFALEGRRAVNIDPGYVALEHVILATTKGYAHRVHLKNGIYADLTLMYRDGTYRPLEWTYPDYAEAHTISLFIRWREYIKKVLKCQKV